ncbi:siderophore-interacting protein [Umezawaea tangerina]|uniref:NADPH-dependent ferric siderophore reductase n=1 Tax=Umezawaea tangerina TaxID=84725 RepID=A0A2T0T7E8_9PSEU|nr:siderophore-interacting protein [Umezawaea tangerina]PRY41600.1 NADPH-dependent ferric siderophore reductase [Umezawaea tangerina]
MKSRLLDRLLVAAQVHTIESLGPRMRLVTLTGPDLAGLDWQPGRHVRLQVAAGPAAVDWLVGVLRTYTVWHYHDQTMQLVVFDHGDGPGAHWARTTRSGDELMLMKPQGSFVTAPAPYHLFVGEETAQAAFGPMLRALPDGTKAFGVIEVDSPEERLELGSGATLEWSYRRGRSAASSETLVEAVRGLELPAEPGRAYLAGEARTIQLVRRHLVEERNWPRRNVLTKPFWTPGRKGMD